MSIRIVWLVLVTLATASSTLAELSDRQLRTLDGITRDRFTGRWVDLGTNELKALRTRADAYVGQFREHHLVGNQVVSLRYTDTNRTTLDSYEALEDSAAWTGLAMAMHAYRYAVTRDNRDLVGENPSLPAIRTLLDGIEAQLQASGRPGYLARFTGRAADGAYKKFYSNYGGLDPARPGFGKLAFAGGTNAPNTVWLGGPSRDQYAALNLGFATVWKLVRNDARIRQRIATNITLILDRIEADQGRLDDGHGHLTFVTPALAAALFRTGATVNPDRFGKAYELHAREFLDLPAAGMVRYGDSRPGLFVAFNLLSLVRMEADKSARQLVYQDRLSQLWRNSSAQLNPQLAICYMGSLERTPNDPSALATIQGILSQYPEPPRWASTGMTSTNAATPLVEVGGVKWTRFAQLLDRRPVAPFQWSQSPYLISGGESAPVVHPGLDFLLAFWMSRDAGVIPSEDAPPPIATFTPRKSSSRTNSPAATNRVSQPKKP